MGRRARGAAVAVGARRAARRRGTDCARNAGDGIYCGARGVPGANGTGGADGADGTDGADGEVLHGTIGWRGLREEALSASDPYRFTTIAHGGRDILGPIRAASWDALLAELPREQPVPNVLDVGCGKAELLLRAVEATGATGVGVEPNPAFAADARERAARRLGPGRVTIIEAELSAAALPSEKFALGICTGSIHVFGEWPDALRGMTPLISEGGVALMAPTYWQRPPHPDYLAAIQGDENEAQSLRATLAAAESAGWRVLASHESTREEWDDYEHTYAANVRAWCDANPDDPDAAAFRKRIDDWAAAYAKWGCETMGYALLLMQRKA